MNKIEIKYCSKCRWLLRASWMAQEVLSTFEDEVDELSLLPGTGGIFEITVNDQLIWSRKEMGGFPEIAELKKLVRDIVAPDRNLGCIDRK
ncbi:SelT/SelW/SelH family protein [Psychromonas sp. SR45-3]|uniref:SelT/SelW/SelH family protein n=1 Tax=Psychromonas sp. SR45-3 TaxID=2760930 RepID=UPI0015F7A534|nr:SelT/SelW/SelH family protein [Psychromonas sp. SR45-3]MBB1274441.1 SelT/SelW/SelH family protein [Psychromonas sp. SR45-3]